MEAIQAAKKLVEYLGYLEEGKITKYSGIFASLIDDIKREIDIREVDNAE